MNDFLNNEPNKFDDYLKNMLDNYQADVSPNLWGSLKLKLLKKDVLDFVSFKKLSRSFKPQTKIGVSQIKVWVSYAAAACFTVALAFGSTYFYKNVISGFEKKLDVSGKTSPTPTKHTINKTITIPDIASPETNQIIEHPQKHDVQQNQTIPLNTNNNNVVQNLTVNTNNTPQPIDNKPDKSDVQTSLLQYIDKLNSKEKPIDNEADIQKYADTIDVTVADSENYTPADDEPYAYNLEIPNVFTPNGDGYNDYFVIKNLDKYSFSTLLIANRSGKVVFDITNYQNNWDARDLPEGTYYYVLTYKDNKQNKGIIKGTVSVVR